MHLNNFRQVFLTILTSLSFLAFAHADHSTLHSTPCNAAGVVGGGALGNSPGPVGPPNSLGWDVGSGQCNGSFTIVTDTKFPSVNKKVGIELGMRAEQRRVGQVPNNGGDYTVLTGDDPGTNGTRAWWNFQHSIAYDGNIGDLDAVCFWIETDEGSSVPVAPVNLLDLRAIIDDRNNQPNATATWSDLYQTSQNPVFGWFTSYDMNQEGAWYLTLSAHENGRAAEVNICIHTPNAACKERRARKPRGGNPVCIPRTP